jgi:outer membrane protein TolC
MNPNWARHVYHGGLTFRPAAPLLLLPRFQSRDHFEWSNSVMRFDKLLCARTAVAAGLVASVVSVFGPAPVHAQTTPALAATAQPGPVRRMTIDDAVASALEQNLDLQVQRINPQLRDLDIAGIETSYTPNFTTSFNLVDQTQPPANLLAGNTSQLTTGRSSFDFGASQLTPWYGGSYQVSWNNGRTTTNNIYSSFQPQLTSNISATYTQPLLRNFKIDGTRQQLLVSQKNREIADTQLRQSISSTVRNVRNAYYDLMYAIGNLNVQRQSLDLARQSLKDNRARVEIGTMAPLDIVQAEAEVATREEAVILAEAAIDRQQDTVRVLVYNPSSPDFWTARIEPIEQVSFLPMQVDVDSAVRNALSQRTDLAVARKNLESTDVNIRYFDNQSKPDLNASINYGAQAIGGVAIRRAPGDGLIPGDIISQVERSYWSTLGTVFSGDFPGWTFSLDMAYPIGRSNNEASLARARLQKTQGERSLAVLELQIATQVRDAARNVQTNAKRVDATRASRALAEKRLEAEEKKYQAGMTSSFFVLQAQRDLNVARNSELLALVEYAKSVVNYAAVQESPLFGQ